MLLRSLQAIKDEQPNSFFEAIPTNVGHEHETIAFTLDRAPEGWVLAGEYERFDGGKAKFPGVQDDPKTIPKMNPQADPKLGYTTEDNCSISCFCWCVWDNTIVPQIPAAAAVMPTANKQPVLA